MERNPTKELKFVRAERSLLSSGHNGREEGEKTQVCGCGYGSHVLLLSKAVCNLRNCLRKEAHARMLEANKQLYDSFLTANSGNHRKEFNFTTTLDQNSRIDSVSSKALEPEQRML